MASDEESLSALEGLMDEFFLPLTSNERKRQIEEILNSFSQQSDAWRHCMYYMMRTKNQYVSMYCMNVLESLINRQWIGFQGSDKSEIRSALNQFLLSHHDKIPTFLRNKLVKLVVDIGRLDWPHFYPDFFSNIIQLIQNVETASLGLILLQTASEEMACPREDLSVARKEELHKLLLQQVPTCLSLLNSILQSILEKHRSMVTATPPPSPTQGQKLGETARRSPMSVISSSPTPSGNLLSNMFRSPKGRVTSESLPPLDATAQQLSLLALTCLAHLFSWIPLSSTITPAMLSTIFHFAVFGCEVSPARRGTNSRSEADISVEEDSVQSLGVLAMCCINELLSKNCVPCEFEEYLLQMFQQTFYLLQRITKDSTTNASGNRLAELDENYIDKFTEFLRLFVSIHLRRFESNSQFPILEFLSLLFKYTFKQPSNEGLFVCLDIWCVFLDYLSTKATQRISDSDNLLAKYREALLSLLSQVLQKFQFRYNQSHLDELDDESLDDNSETEWQHYLRQCLETIAHIADLLPVETFRYVYEALQGNLDVYLGLESFITSCSNGDIPPEGTTSLGRRLTIMAENECRKLHCSLRDLSSLLQAIGRLSHHFTGEHYADRFSDAQILIERLINTAAYGSKLKLYEVNSVGGGVLQSDFVEVHAQALATVKTNMSWLAQYHIDSQQDQNKKLICDNLITAIIDTIMPLFVKGTPDKVTHSAAHLLLSVMTTVRAAHIIQLSSVQNFYNQTSQGALQAVSLEVQLLVYRSLSHFLLLPWPVKTDTQQDWTSRASHHNTYISQLTNEYTVLKSNEQLPHNKDLQLQAKSTVKRNLQILTDLVETIAIEGVSKSKQICYSSVQQCVQTTLALFPVYIHHTDVTEEMLQFFLALFQGLRVQMGVAFTEQIIQTFISMFTREQLSEIIQQESAAGVKVIEKFLQILQVIVQEPGAAFKAFLPNIIVICMDQIYPMIAERSSPDIKPSLYELLHQLLDHNWRSFFKTNVLDSLHAKNASEEVDNQHHFIAIMQAFGQSFLQPDIAVFRQNLEALDNLHSKWKLYNKKLFQDVMLFQFLNVLLQVLLAKSHDLLQEEIVSTLYNMAAVDFDSFYAKFLPHFLQSCDLLGDSQKSILNVNVKRDKDLPSFTQNILRLVNDLRYYQLCNSSLPAGSVKF